ncbi:MAG: hypothetical protein GXZ09_10925 [Syntrophomonadaceae bacterium]|jgi:hypothetical protein|nr:hypothetical protein [Syntrophomonadaceae bacterium]
MKLSNSPTAAMLWSLCIPGFGQLYNRDYINGLVLVALEFLINVQAKLNLAILFSFRGQIDVANQIADIQWLLFYPCVYSYSMWQAYNRAAQICRLHAEASENCHRLRYNGPFIGAAMGGTLGIIYLEAIGVVLGGILGMIAGAVIGCAAERLVNRRFD